MANVPCFIMPLVLDMQRRSRLTGNLLAAVVMLITIAQYALGEGDGELQQIVRQFKEEREPIENVIQLKLPYNGNIGIKVFVGVAPKILGEVSKDGTWHLDLTHVRIEDGELLLCNESNTHFVLRERAHYVDIIPSVDELAKADSNADIERLIGECDDWTSYFTTSGEATVENVVCRWIKWSVQKDGDVTYSFVKTTSSKGDQAFKAFSMQSGILKQRQANR